MEPIIKVDDVAFPTLQVPDLALQEQFLIHFGMKRAALTEDTLYMHGEGPQAFIHVSTLGEKKFIGNAFQALSLEDVEKLSSEATFSDVEALSSPGGGYVTRTIDPDGIEVQVVYGIEPRGIDSTLDPAEFNVGGQGREAFQRLNKIKRFVKGAYPRIKRYGHCGLNAINPEASLEWYNHHLGIIASDLLKPGGEAGPTMGIFSRCDRGAKPADHHSIFWLPAPMLSNGNPGLNHVSYEMMNIDDVFMGHEVMKREGYEHEWGVGRHYQGSQIFDYWRSPFDHTHEHQTDGDVFDNTIPPQIVDVIQDGDPARPEEGPPSQWGPALNIASFGSERGF